jgi:hypothetical protein
MFLLEHLDLLLDSGQLLFLYCRCFFLGFVVPIIDLDVIRLLFPRGWLTWISFGGLT